MAGIVMKPMPYSLLQPEAFKEEPWAEESQNLLQVLFRNQSEPETFGVYVWVAQYEQLQS